MVPPPPRDDEPARVLVLAPVGRDGPAVAALLGKAGLAAELCRDLDELVAGLEAGAEAACVAEEAPLGQPD